MKITLTDQESVQLLSSLNERKAKYTALYELANLRKTNGKFLKNADRLMSSHKRKIEVAESLINKIAKQF